jgi:signal transduction histidine kinase
MPRRINASVSGHTILVVDDQEETLVSVRQLLEREGHRVLIAESGEHALALLKEHDVHLLLVDYFMPRMTGEELVRRVRQFDCFVQIILQTGYAGEKPPRQTLARLDIQGYHDKAEGPEKLLLWVDTGLKAHRVIRRLRASERMQAELVANVSHELRTPLSIVQGYSEILGEELLGAMPASAIAPLQAIDRAAQSLNHLVSDFLLYAKLGAQVLDIEHTSVSIGELIGEIEELAEAELQGRPLHFRVDTARAPAAIVSDRLKLRVILRNLVNNAIKFTTEGQVVLRIEQRASSLRFIVEDTGCGIPPDDIERIFQPFRQLDGSNTRLHAGIGLGLPLAQKLAQLLGGSLEVEGRPGSGSTFTLVLPASLAADTPRDDTADHLEGSGEVGLAAQVA